MAAAQRKKTTLRGNVLVKDYVTFVGAFVCVSACACMCL